MDANQKLIQFMDSVTRGTDAEIAKAEQEAQQDAAEILRAAQAECSAQAERQIAEKKAKLRRNTRNVCPRQATAAKSPCSAADKCC